MRTSGAETAASRPTERQGVPCTGSRAAGVGGDAGQIRRSRGTIAGPRLTAPPRGSPDHPAVSPERGPGAISTRGATMITHPRTPCAGPRRARTRSGERTDGRDQRAALPSHDALLAHQAASHLPAQDPLGRRGRTRYPARVRRCDGDHRRALDPDVALDPGEGLAEADPSPRASSVQPVRAPAVGAGTADSPDLMGGAGQDAVRSRTVVRTGEALSEDGSVALTAPWRMAAVEECLPRNPRGKTWIRPGTSRE